MAQKLIKIAKEFNVGLHTIVETLHGRGFPDVEEKPTADITDAMLVVLQQEFQKDLAIKQEADKLARPVLKKEPTGHSASPATAVPTTPPTPTAPTPPVQRTSFLPSREEGPRATPTPPPVPPPPSPKQAAPEPPPPPPVAPVAPAAPVVTAPKAKPEETEVSHRERTTHRVLGRIDLNPPKPAPRTEPKPQPQPPKAEPAVAKQQPAPPATPPQESKTPPPVTTPVTPGTDEPAAPAAPESEFYRADAPQLRGLKILGRISLDKPKPESTGGGDNRGGRRDGQAGNNNRGGRRDGPNAGGGQGANRNGSPGQGGQNRPATNADGTPATPGTGSANANDSRRKRTRKKVQTPVNTTNVPASPSAGASVADRRGRGPMGNRPDAPKEVSQKDIEDQIRQTMARMGAGASRKRQKVRRDKRDVRRERAEMAAQERTEGEKKLQVTEFISVSDLASMMSLKPSDIIKTCMSLGIFVSINQRLDAELIEVVASEFDFEVQFISAEEQVEVEEEVEENPNDLVARQPIVTVMGHVDHGKTSLLDFIRSANVAEGEAGGITQHIGAYEVMVGDQKDKRITFLDTPGHEAFTAMRARGAKVTDIAIIVIAADDSIMPQTREAISHAQAAGVPLVFAINKIDKAGADPERIKNELAQMNLLVEEWGGKYQSQDISAKKGENVDKLLEKVLLEAELLELKANPDRRAVGTVLEASLDKGRGYVTKILVENGTIRDGDPIIAGEFAGKVKAMFNERGKKIKEAGPATPVLVLGLPGAPQAGEKIKVAASDSEAKEIASKRSQIMREQTNRASKRISLEEIGRRLALGNFKELNLIVKGDVDGSIEALTDSLIKLSIDKVQVNVIHKAVGQIVDSDVMLASASDAIIIGFQVRPSITARKLAEKEGVEIKLYSIIYETINEIKAAIEGMLEPTKEEEIVGQVEIREVYKISKIGAVAGSYVLEGKISRNHYIRLIRDGIVVYPVNANQNAELGSLKRFKEDAKEVRAGMECGLTIKNFNDMKPGDIVEAYVINEVKATLK